MRNLFRSLSVFLVLTLLFVFSCKQDVQTKQTKGDSQEGFLAEDFSEKEINSSYLDTRSLKDELVEALILNDYKLSESSVDEALVKYVLGPDVKTLPAVYKKDVQTLLKYTLSQIKRDSCAIEFDEDKNDEIIVKAFDFYIDGIDGFAIVSNDERLGALISVFIGDNANKEGKKSKAILEINALMNEIKKEWGSITFSDVTDVAQRAWGVEIIDKTRGFNDFLRGIEGAALSIGKAIGFEPMRWNSPVVDSAKNHILDDYMDVDGNMADSLDEDFNFYENFHSALTDIIDYAFWREKILKKIVPNDISEDDWLCGVLDLHEHLPRFRPILSSLSDADFKEAEKMGKVFRYAEESLGKCRNEFNKSTRKAYAPYRGVLLRTNFTAKVMDESKKTPKINTAGPAHEHVEIRDYDAIYSLISTMLINESPVISYSYIDALGNKKTINNIWKYIKQLNPSLKDGKRDEIIRTLRLVDQQGKPVAVHKVEDITSRSNVSMDVVRRILMHLEFLIMGGCDDKYMNVYWRKILKRDIGASMLTDWDKFGNPIYSECDMHITWPESLIKSYNNIEKNENVKKFVREFIKEKFGYDIGDIKFQTTGQNEYESKDKKYDKFNNILVDVADKFGYKLVTWKKRMLNKDYYMLLDLFSEEKNSKEMHEKINAYVQPIIDQKGIIVSNCRWYDWLSYFQHKEGVETGRHTPITEYRAESRRGYQVLFGVKDYKYKYRNELNTYIYPYGKCGEKIDHHKYDTPKKVSKKLKEDYEQYRLTYYPVENQMWGISVGIVKDRDVPSISLPLKSKDGKTLIDVIKNGKFNLEYENEAFKPKKKNNANAVDTTQINDGLITVTSADSDSNHIPFYPNPDSIEDLNKQRKQGGKKIYEEEGVRVSFPGKK